MFIPSNLVEQAPNEHYEGLNGSALEVLGQIKVKILLDHFNADEVILRVMPNNVMKANCILGRDAMKSLGLSLATSTFKEKCENVAQEILNIESSVFDGDESETLDVNRNLSGELRDKILHKIRTTYLLPERLPEPIVRAELKLHVKEKQPFHFAPGRLSQTEKVQLREIIEDLLERKVIQPGSSEYASRTVLVKKKNVKIRLCIDYRALNKITARDNYPLPIIEEQIDMLCGKCYFSSLDLKEGFHHMFMSEDSVKYTAFVTPFGQYEYLKMPFGLKNAPARFQRYVNEVLSGLIRSGDVVVYVDDFLVATETLEKHLEILERVFRILVQNLLELRLDKCRFGYEEI